MNVEQAPVLNSVVPNTITQNEQVTFTFNGLNFKDGASIQFFGPVNGELPTNFVSSKKLTLTAIIKIPIGTYQVKVKNPDGQQSNSLPIEVVRPRNRAPILDPIGAKSVNEGQELEFTISASDPDNDALTFSASSLPTGAKFVGDTFFWTPGFNQAGTYFVTFIVTDGKLSDSETIKITVIDSNRAPVLNKIGNKVVYEGQLLKFTVSASDPDKDQVTISAINLPSGAVFDGITFSWIPNSAQSGLYKVTYIASDGYLTDSETVTIVVKDVNLAPILDSIGDKTVKEGQSLEFTISAYDPLSI
jgi:hypothetical protein